MSEKVLGGEIEVKDQVGAWQREEILFLTSDGVIVARTGWGLARKFGETGAAVLFASVMLIAIMVTVSVSSALHAYMPEVGMTLYMVVVLGPLISSGVAFSLYFIVHLLQSRKKKKEYVELSPEDILHADIDNFAITGSEVSKVELWEDWDVKYYETPWERLRSQCGLKIILNKEIRKHSEYKWKLPKGADWDAKSYLSYYKNLLRPIFGDKLSVKKSGRFLIKQNE